jgi:hypothetical protein
MDLYESNTHSFIVKIWLEETVEEDGRATWRGHITHVLSGKRRYLKELDEITAFIRPYLEQAGGVDFGLQWRIGNWLARFGTYFGRRHVW